MTTHVVTLAKPVPEELREEVGEKLSYAWEHIVAHALAADGATVTVTLAPGAATAEAESRVTALVDGMVRRHRDLARVVLREHRLTPAHTAPVWDDLAAARLVEAEGPGLVALSGEMAEVVEALDQLLARRARSTYGARPHQYPSMLPMEALDRADYFSSFPHHVTFPLHVKTDLEAIEDLARIEASRRESFASVLDRPRHVMNPAVCYHAFLGLADRTIERETITAMGRCFRHEARNFATLERVWEFSLREIVFVGPGAWVEERRQTWVDEAMGLVDDLGLDAWVETANDPFFLKNFAANRFFQLATQTKYELRLSLPYAPGRSLAAASFNQHRDFFGTSFRIATDAGPAHSACVGFGLERCAWALFAQHGPRIPDWPERTRKTLGLGA